MNQVDLYNTPTSPINDVVYNAVWISDTWKLTNRLTLNLGGRVEHYRDGWDDQEFVPNGHSDARQLERSRPIAPSSRQRTVDARTVAETMDFAPRAGFAYDLSGDNRTVLKVFSGMFNFNSADLLADQENPVGPRPAPLRLQRSERQPPARWPARAGHA